MNLPSYVGFGDATELPRIPWHPPERCWHRLRVVAGQRERAKGKGHFHHRGRLLRQRENGGSGAADLAPYLNANAQILRLYEWLQMHKFTPISVLALKLNRKNY